MTTSEHLDVLGRPPIPRPGRDLTVRANWNWWCSFDPPEPPHRYTRSEFNSLSKADRDAWLEYRNEWIAAFDFMVDTPAGKEAEDQIRSALAKSRPTNMRPASLVTVTGPYASGKTSLVQSLMRFHQRSQLAATPEDQRDFVMPAIYAQAPEGGSLKMMSELLGRAVNAPEAVVYRSTTEVELREKFLASIEGLDTKVIAIDEIQRLPGTGAAGYLKELLDATPGITWVFIGADLAKRGPFSGDEKAQLLARMTLKTVEPFTIADDAGRDAWEDFLYDLEPALPLLELEDEALVGLADYLYKRTGGLAAATATLLQDACLRAIDTKTEKITKALLDTVHVPEEVARFAGRAHGDEQERQIVEDNTNGSTKRSNTKRAPKRQSRAAEQAADALARNKAAG